MSTHEVVLITLLLFSISSSDIIPSNNYKNKLKSILVPKTGYFYQSFLNPNVTLSLYPIKSPSVTYGTEYSDYCNNYDILNNDLFRNGSFCQKMFCEENNVLFEMLNQNITTGNQTVNYLYYYSAYYTCKYCESEINQTYLNGTFETCKWSYELYSNETDFSCDSYYINILTLRYCYYPSLKMYITPGMNVELFFIFFYTSFWSFFITAAFLPLFIFTIFILIPIIYDIVLKLKNPLLVWKERLRIIFSLQNFNLLFLLIFEISMIILSMLDRLIQDIDLSTECLIVGFIFMTLIYLFLTTLYLHISQTNVINIEDSINFKVVIFFIIFLFLISLLGLILLCTVYIGGIITRWIYSLTLIFGTILLFILGIVLFVSSLIITIKLTFTSDGTELLKMKVRNRILMIV